MLRAHGLRKLALPPLRSLLLPSRSCSYFSIMTKESTPPPAEQKTTTAENPVSHEPPSLPASPVAKRQKPDTSSKDSGNMSSTNGSSASSTLPPLQVKKLVETAKPPTRGSAFAAGYDMYAAKETVIPAKGKALVDTGIAVAVPEGTYGRVAPRSGLASKHFIDVGAGVIDADYRGEVKVLLFNFSEVDFTSMSLFLFPLFYLFVYSIGVSVV